MKISDAMTKSPQCATADTSLTDIARMMIDCDCGAVPVVGDPTTRLPIGMVTDRDIVVRAVAAGLDPAAMVARDVMSTPAITIRADLSLSDAIELLEQHQIRRAIVVDRMGACIGIVAPADVAAHASKRKAGELLREVSQPWSTGNDVMAYQRL
jgi:CBS domain-containing protein